MNKSILCLFIGGLSLIPSVSSAVVTTYTNEATYLTALASIGRSVVEEGFENDAVWGITRNNTSPGMAVSVNSQGITWTSNNTTSQVRTSGGASRSGSWGFFSNPHGDYLARGDVVCAIPNVCSDGFVATGATTRLYGVGGWFEGTPGSQLDFILDGVNVDFGNGTVTQIDGLHKFLAVIETDGFSKVEIRENEGTFEDRKSISADDFSLGVGTLPANSPPVANAGPDQSTTVGSTVTLDGSDSSDVDNDPLSYSWVLSTKPGGSNASLSSLSSIMPTFDVDLPGVYTAELVVNDGAVNSNPDSVSITTENVTPVARAGPDQNVMAGALVTLDGSGSSDADGDPLSYSWTLTSKPGGSIAGLSNTTNAMPTFSVDLTGTYTATLVVNDGTVDSPADSVNIATGNTAPVANAGLDLSVLVGANVLLDGGGSSDADGNPLTYNWSLTSKPAGSIASLSNSTSIMPAFSVDLAGMYIAQLVVNDGAVDSAPDTVSISTGNSAPVANAGLDQSVSVGASVTLDGSSSSDADGDSLSYSWSLLNVPTGSNTSLSANNIEMPVFSVDLVGTYTAQLVVNDGLVNSSPDSVNIATGNVAPVANAGTDQSISVGKTVTLDGGGSNDANGDPLSFNWSLISKPTGSNAGLSATDISMPTFDVDLAGIYIAQLVVNDGIVNSIPDTTEITATAATSTQTSKSGGGGSFLNLQSKADQLLLLLLSLVFLMRFLGSRKTASSGSSSEDP